MNDRIYSEYLAILREEIVPARDGRIVAVTGKQGKNVVKGEIVAFVE